MVCVTKSEKLGLKHMESKTGAQIDISKITKKNYICVPTIILFHLVTTHSIIISYQIKNCVNETAATD